MTIKKLEKRVFRLGSQRDCYWLYEWIRLILWESNRRGMHIGQHLVVRQKGNKHHEYYLDPSWFTVRLTRKPTCNDHVLLKLTDFHLCAILIPEDVSFQDTFVRDENGNYSKDEYGNFLLRDIYTETMYANAIDKVANWLHEDALK